MGEGYAKSAELHTIPVAGVTVPVFGLVSALVAEHVVERLRRI
ncbi:MAG: hypothetical protein JWM72_600 [Actinomycetia bacterium]|nr:hypothetical protein [Actinomycetes bacterium]